MPQTFILDYYFPISSRTFNNPQSIFAMSSPTRHPAPADPAYFVTILCEDYAHARPITTFARLERALLTNIRGPLDAFQQMDPIQQLVVADKAIEQLELLRARPILYSKPIEEVLPIICNIPRSPDPTRPSSPPYIPVPSPEHNIQQRRQDREDRRQEVQRILDQLVAGQGPEQNPSPVSSPHVKFEELAEENIGDDVDLGPTPPNTPVPVYIHPYHHTPILPRPPTPRPPSPRPSTPSSSPSLSSYHDPASIPSTDEEIHQQYHMFQGLPDDFFIKTLADIRRQVDTTTRPLQFARPTLERRLRPDDEVSFELRNYMVSTRPSARAALDRAVLALGDEGIAQDVQRYRDLEACVTKLTAFKHHFEETFYFRSLELKVIANRLVIAEALNLLLPFLATPYHAHITADHDRLRGGAGSDMDDESTVAETPHRSSFTGRCWQCNRVGHRRSDCPNRPRRSPPPYPRTRPPRRTPRPTPHPDHHRPRPPRHYTPAIPVFTPRLMPRPPPSSRLVNCVRNHHGDCRYDCRFCPECGRDVHSEHEHSCHVPDTMNRYTSFQDDDYYSGNTADAYD